jgi:hypothetical protein
MAGLLFVEWSTLPSLSLWMASTVGKRILEPVTEQCTLKTKERGVEVMSCLFTADVTNNGRLNSQVLAMRVYYARSQGNYEAALKLLETIFVERRRGTISLSFEWELPFLDKLRRSLEEERAQRRA